MPCKDYLPLVEKLADGEATPVEKREAEAHLEACDECREHFRFLQSLPAAARQMSPGEPPEIYWDALPQKVMTRIAELDESQNRPRRWLFGFLSPSGLRWAGALAAAALAAVVGLRILDAPFTGESQDALRPLSSAPESGKLDQGVLGEPLEKEERPEPSSEGPLSEPEEGRREVSDLRARPAPASQVANAPSSPAPEEPPGPAGVEERDTLTRAERFAYKDQEAGTGETGPVTLDEARETASREKGRFEAAARPQEARDQPSVATPAPVGARALQTRPDQEAAGSVTPTNAPAVPMRSAEEDYRTLLERYPAESAASADAVGDTTTSNEGAPADKARECADWRQFVDEHGGGEPGTSARYRLALCSIAQYDLQPSDDNRRQAIMDGQAFLAVEPSGDRANAIRRGLERIER